MPVIDLTRYIVASAGTWTDPSQDENLFGFTLADTMSPSRLLLRWAGDFVALTGPLFVRVTVQAENMTVPVALVGNLVPDATAAYKPGTGTGTANATINTGAALSEAAVGRIAKGRALSLSASTIYSYTLDIAAGQAWPFSLSEQLDALRLQNLYTSRFEQLGNNLGFRVVIEPAFATAKLTPVTSGADLPCDFAIADQPNTASFFPVACEPCSGTVIGLPPSGAVSLVTPPADGGCVRTRFFNGMFITREDLEAEQRYHRLKSKLHNRAAGAGVVWGLGVGKQGSQVWVMPGYGVDCCGNDLTLTTTYKVDIAALLADPAAASLVHQRGPHRMHLLLEYVECPSDPRPVHGDPCAPDASRCEMSRIRESVRLRLVPPRDYNVAAESTPIQQFLNEVRELRARYPLGAGPTVLGADRAPFTLTITVTDANGASQQLTRVRPSSEFDSGPLQQFIFASPNTMSIDIVPDPLWTFVTGTLSAQALSGGKPVNGFVQPPNPVDLSLTANTFSSPPGVTFTWLANSATIPDQFVYKITGWTAQSVFAAEDDPALSGDLTLTVQFSGAQIKLVTLTETAISSQPLNLAPVPCEGEPCTPRQGFDSAVFERTALNAAFNFATDPTPVLPWLHADPTHPSSAGDPKAVRRAALGGWLAQMLVREHAGTANEVLSTRREIAQGIYRIAWLLLFGVPESADPAALGGTLKRLLEAWCDGLLWKGLQCGGDPHGVVIGCAVVSAGTIQEIDPFGGRRNVVHYPLLAHWGAQFGIAPLDVMASRFFSTLCCVSALPAVNPTQPTVSASRITVGGGLLLFGDRSQFSAKLNNGEQIVAERRVGTIEFIASVIQAFSTNAPAKTDTPPQYNAVVLGDFVADQTVMLLLPA